MAKNISFNGEFGHELACVIPYAYWHHANGTDIITHSTYDTECFYYFSSRHDSSISKRSCSHAARFPNKTTWAKSLNESEWLPPEYKKHYKNKKFVFSKPICVISNKYNLEWGGQPLNFLDIDTLESLFDMLKNSYQIIYNRVHSAEYLNDGNTRAFELEDFSMIEKKYANDVILMSDLCKHGDTFNTVQCKVMANSNCHISVQGGNSVLASYFSGTNIIYAVHGNEITNNSYGNWFHKLSGANIVHCDSYDKVLAEVEQHYV